MEPEPEIRLLRAIIGAAAPAASSLLLYKAIWSWVNRKWGVSLAIASEPAFTIVWLVGLFLGLYVWGACFASKPWSCYTYIGLAVVPTVVSAGCLSLLWLYSLWQERKG